MKTKTIVLTLLLALCFAASTQTSKGQTPNTATDNKPVAVPQLSDAQKQAIKRIDTIAKLKAAPSALKMASVVSRIYQNMLADKPDEKLRVSLNDELRDVTWQLLTIKGQSIRDIVNVLTPAQKQLIKSEMHKPGAPADLSEVIAHMFKLEDK